MDTCDICSSQELVAPNDGEYKYCVICSVLRTRFNYDPTQYSTAYADNYVNYARTNVNIPLNLFRMGLISRWLKAEDRVLDVGCCVGEFIRFAEKYYRCTGFEPNGIAARKARLRVASEIVVSLNGNVGHNFKCITLFDVLEHIEEPAGFIKHLHNLLDKNGILAITTPNIEALLDINLSTRVLVDPDFFIPFNTLLRKWKHYKPKEHLFLYSETSLEKLLENCGFTTIHWGREESDIRPGNPNGDILTCVARKR